MLVDPGFYCYNGETEWEVHFRKTAAHNTIAIDGRDQARHVSKMAWTHTYTAHLDGASDAGGIGWARGSHDGYADGGTGVIHRRSVWLRDGGYVVILDELSGRPGGIGRANFQFAPGHLEIDGRASALFSGRFELSWTGSVPATATVIDGGESPSGGWIAPSLGVRVPAPRLLLEFPLQPTPVLLLTVVADRQRGGMPGQRRVSFPQITAANGETVVAARVAGPDWHDHLVASAAGMTIHHAGIETDAPLAVVRVTDRGAEERHHVGGTYLRVSEKDLAALVSLNPGS